MANVYAVKSGNWSDTTVWNTSALPTSSDDVYSNNFTVTINQNINILSLRNTSATSITAGGGFTISGDYNIISTSFFKGSTVLITYTGVGTINISVNTFTATGSSNFLNITGNGNVSWVGSITGFSISGGSPWIFKGGTGKLTFTGDISGSIANQAIIELNNGSIELTGNLTISNSSTLNNINSCIYISGNNTNCIVTGSLLNNSTSNTWNTATTNNPNCIFALSITSIKHIGTQQNSSYNAGFCITSTNINSICIFTGSFISNNYGIPSFYVTRVFYQITSGSYYEFRDSSTNGALPPSAAAPATRLVSPDTVVDSPIPANVRDGVSYALNTLTGTLKVPAAGSVALGVPVDNTTGTAVLTPAAVWDYATSSITNANSIGARLKNCSTVDTTGEQLEALL